jgi:hypothetical protein
MPCGGVYPATTSDLKSFGLSQFECWHCDKPGCDLVLEEWDSVIHSACVPAFLKTEEGQIVLKHGHAVIVLEDGKPKTLYEGVN